MPNKRDPNKVSVGVYIDREIRDMVREALAKKGLTLTEYVYAALLELLNGKADEFIKSYKEREHVGRKPKKKT